MKIHTIKNKRLPRAFLLFLLMLLLFLIIININSSLLIRKLEEDDKSYKIYVIIVTISYVIFIVMDLLFILLVTAAKGLEELIFRYIYIANNGYLIMCVFTWIISGHKMVMISSSVGLTIFVIGSIVYLCKFNNYFLDLFTCSFLGSLFQLIPGIWELFFASLDTDCSCFKNSQNCCANAFHYIYTSILVVGFGISTIVYIGFVIILIILWSIFTALIMSILYCCENCDCWKKNDKKNNEDGINNINDNNPDNNGKNNANNNQDNNNNNNLNEEAQSQNIKINDNKSNEDKKEEENQLKRNNILTINKTRESLKENNNEVIGEELNDAAVPVKNDNV